MAHSGGGRLAARAGAASARGRETKPWSAVGSCPGGADRQRSQAVERLEQMGLGNAVVDMQPVLARAHKVGGTQGHEVLGDCGLAFTKHRLEVTDANLTRPEELQDVETGRVRQGAQ